MSAPPATLDPSKLILLNGKTGHNSAVHSCPLLTAVPIATLHCSALQLCSSGHICCALRAAVQLQHAAPLYRTLVSF